MHPPPPGAKCAPRRKSADRAERSRKRKYIPTTRTAGATSASVDRVKPRKKVDNRVVMRIAIAVTVAVLAATPIAAQSSPAPSAARPAPDLVYEGELETYIAIGGESTGWRLRTRTPQGRRQFIEVLLTAEVAQGVRANIRVQIRGTMTTRRYVERGDVQVLMAKEVIEVARR